MSATLLFSFHSHFCTHFCLSRRIFFSHQWKVAVDCSVYHKICFNLSLWTITPWSSLNRHCQIHNNRCNNNNNRFRTRCCRFIHSFIFFRCFCRLGSFPPHWPKIYPFHFISYRTDDSFCLHVAFSPSLSPRLSIYLLLLLSQCSLCWIV